MLNSARLNGHDYDIVINGMYKYMNGVKRNVTLFLL